MDKDEDITLMLEFKSGKAEAFNRLVDKYSKPVINYIFRFTGSREDAQDLAQDVFIRVTAQQRTILRPRNSPHGFTAWQTTFPLII